MRAAAEQRDENGTWRDVLVSETVDPEITIILESTGPMPRFRLRAPDGGVPRVTSVTIVELASEEPVWWVLPAAFAQAETLRFEVSEPSEHDVARLASQEEMDPLEDLPPTDPRHQRALRERAEIEQATLVPLSTITYGILPEGFRQVLPGEGPAPQLTHDGSYGIHVMGAGVAGYLAFGR